ncbi:MAG: aminopeptidase [Coriobacteriales bacterium]|jgi:aminopeptidase|nr:aminopeptidase [Coriobacteriales bacterium]
MAQKEYTLNEQLERYAELVIKAGCNLQPGQELYLAATTDQVEFARLLTAAAYKQGARHVTVAFGDERISRMHYDNCALEVFQNIPEWSALRNNEMARDGAAILSLTGQDPLIMAGIDPAKPMASAVAGHTACKEFYDAMDLGRNVWCIVGAATPAWAKHVFPDLPEDDAMARLWEAIFTTVRLDADDAIAAWDEHRRTFDARKAWLNEQHFDSLHYTNSLGTDLRIGLNPRGIWNGGGDVTRDGVEFFPNMPTEEVYTTPNFNRVDGTVYSALPLVHNGSLIEDFCVTFKDGRAIASDARVGAELLAAIIAADEGSCRLGECALIPYDSPIRNSGVLFYDTLFDENASCHLALGKGFPDCIDGGMELDETGLHDAGVNDSAVHVDFMVGTKDLNIDGIAANGDVVPVFRNGNWAGALSA